MLYCPLLSCRCTWRSSKKPRSTSQGLVLHFLIAKRILISSFPLENRDHSMRERFVSREHRTIFALEEIPFDRRFCYLKYLVHAIKLFLNKALGFRFYNLSINDSLSSRQKDFAFVDANSAV